MFKSISIGRKVMSMRTVSRSFCYPTPLEVTPAIRRRNAVTAVSLLVSVGAVYYFAMAAMKEEIFDDTDLEEEALVQEKTA